MTEKKGTSVAQRSKASNPNRIQQKASASKPATSFKNAVTSNSRYTLTDLVQSNDNLTYSAESSLPNQQGIDAAAVTAWSNELLLPRQT